ncbi:MAG: filamentous hemagglutinin N-terminal domain-containing protein [Coleofasciculus chthonoplastes F3-SA18-01]|uniref:two-partner secretion domain-containing protein n=1 Tax=Coleofasciculus chthonoplastes TaxID=64178 RepID=UPI0033041457
MMKNWINPFWIGSVVLGFWTNVTTASAQIVPDNTLPVNSQVTGCPVCLIEGGTVRGVNLFHSFDEFSVQTGGEAFFNNALDIENILGRVTGANISDIDGLIRANGTANLFLINPNGVVFGENARLDVGGSFVASTANSFTFPDGSEFSATNPQAPPLLTINVTPGLQYGTPPTGDINHQGNLAVESGQTLALYGNQVTSTGSLTALGGTVMVLGERIGLFGSAEIDVSSDIGGGTVLIGGSFQGQGTIPTAARTVVEPDVTINADALIDGDGGTVVLWADEVTGFYGNINARGGVNGGNGGLVEVSGKQHLIFRGNVDTSAAFGLAGTLLLDPIDIRIANGSGDSGVDGEDSFAGNNSGVTGAILSTPLSEIDDTAPTTIYESELEGLAGDTNIVLQATNDIRIDDLADDALDFAPGNGEIVFTADADSDGVGSVVMEDTVADTLNTHGRDIKISGASLTLGDINTIGFEGGELIATVDVDAGGAIPETGTKGTAIFTFTVPDLRQPVGNLDVRFSAAHTWDANLNVYLKSPSGTELKLFNNVGASGDNFQDTLLDDEATTNINLGFSPFNRSFTPGGAGGLAVFQGENPKGTWRLSVTDNYDEDNGRLFRAGDAAPWGDAIGTQLLFRTPITRIRESGSINLNATNGSINVGKLNTNNPVIAGGAIRLDASGSITTGVIDSSSSVNGGAITLRADGNIITNGMLDSSSFSSSGKAGDGGAITLISDSGNITTNDWLYSVSFSESGKAENGGAITLTSDSGNITTNDWLYSVSSSFSSSGNARDGGAITLTSDSGNITTNSGLISVSFSESGKAGDGGAITLSSNSGNITTNSQLGSVSQSSSGKAGDGGAITLTSDSGNIITNQDWYSYSYSQFGKAGDGGEISLIAKGGNIIGHSDNGSLLASFSLSLSEEGNAGRGGNVTLSAHNRITNLEVLTLSSSNKAGNVQVNGIADLSITNTQILTSRGVEVTLPRQEETVILDVGGQGQSGNVTVASLGNLTFDNSSIRSHTNGFKDAGTVLITSPEGITFNNSQIIASTSNVGNAGNIILNTPKLTLENNTEIATSTRGTGNAGDITFNLDKGRLSIQDGATVSVSSQSEQGESGQAGNLFITADSVVLNQGTLFAETGSSREQEGANITLTGLNLLLMNNESLISAEALNQANGGNITIESTHIIVLPAKEDNGSDIIAKAQEGNGGNINITAAGVYGIDERLAVEGNRTNDIDASSQFGNPGEITLDVSLDPSRGLTQLPSTLVDPSGQINRTCAASNRQSQFTITGRGGLPENPTDLFSPDLVQDDFGTVIAREEDEEIEGQADGENSPIYHPPKQIIEAQGWIIDAEGNVVLTAYAPNGKPHGGWQNSVNCQVSETASQP